MVIHASEKRRSKKLLRLFRGLQQDDEPVSPHHLTAAKHLFRGNRRCCVVQVEDDLRKTMEIKRSLISGFLTSQLEAQRLIDASSSRIVVSPLLVYVFFLSHNCAPEKQRSSAFPTLFRWYCPAKHRSYVVFAFVDTPFSMGGCTYTISELLELRYGGAPPGSASLDGTARPEIAEIARRSGSECATEAKKASSTKQKDDSSSSEEQLLFRGNMSRRAPREPLREQPNREQVIGDQPSRETIRETTRETTREPVREPTREPTREPVPSSGAPNISGRHLEWKYHGRSESDATTGEPISAPTGIPAQKHEGFQRFYKAVVSPTHVRVTAGGRIVPNTRGPLSPSTKRSKDGSLVDENKTNVNPKLAATQMGVGQTIPAMVPQMFPGYPAGLPPMQTALPFLPTPFGVPLSAGFPYPQAALNPAAMGQHPHPPPANMTKNSEARSGNEQTSGPSGGEKSEKFKISPPELFDYTKPFHYNGQLLYPFPAAFPNSLGFPMGLFPYHPGMGGPFAAQMLQHMPNGLPTMMAAAGAANHPAGPAMPPPAVNPNIPAAASFKPPSAPPASSIRPSEITKKQIAGFKSNLKYHTDQLTYNKHQIDEEDMKQKIQVCQDHIRRFEAVLDAQLKSEAELFPKPSQANDSSMSSQSSAAKDESKKAQSGSESMPSPVFQDARSPMVGVADATQRRKDSRSRSALQSAGDSFGGGRFEPFPGPAHANSHDMTNKAGLPSDAALAPPFQPRGYGSSASWVGSDRSREIQEETERRLMMAGAWKPPQDLKPAQQLKPEKPFNAGSWKMSREAKMESERRLLAAGAGAWTVSESSVGEDLRPSSQGSNFREVSSQSTKSFQPKHNLGVPYLLGTLPKGVNPRTATDQDYVYNRPLTEEEIRSRYLYWGQAPKSALHGLPKYDGKHFYPASPVKECNKAEPESPNPVPRRVPTARLATDHDFQLSKSEADPFRPITPFNDSSDETGLHARAASYETQVRGTPVEFEKAMHVAEQAPEPILKTRENSVDAASVASHDRRSEKSGSKLWQTMLRKGATSSAVSSTTAQGFLPHYTGHAAASLSPTLTKDSTSPSGELSPTKVSDGGDLTEGGAPLSPELGKRIENRSPKAVAPLEDQATPVTVPVSVKTAAAVPASSSNNNSNNNNSSNLPRAFDF